ncbi:methyltransferase [Pilimelia anulata]|uniref:Methyltransferase n=1 Tax=Pilimelia anulata TaxID=53371 RepID=A0A8J3F9F1_9ACTN|nr:class I SAM-dependent methyltransferase [Pilimelia anulata]GGJ92497.1 methyltransferase [Pilimelia anulata]
MVIDGWEWDESLFAGAAPYYVRGRLPYAPGWIDALRAALDLDGRGELLDVGCGPGHVTLALAPLFAGAVGLDPDRGMLAEAARRAAAGPPAGPAVRWVRARAEDLPAGLGTFRVILFASSFHWLDRAAVAAAARRMLAPGGALVHVADLKDPPPAATPLPRPAPPYPAIAALVRRHLGPVRRAGRGRIAGGTPDGEDAVIAGAGFPERRRYVVPAGQVRDRSADDLVAWAFSRSDSAPHLFGDRAAAFEGDLRALLRAAAPGGRFAEHLPPTEIRVWPTPRR